MFPEFPKSKKWEKYTSLMLEIKELVLYITSKCNKDCKHCYIEERKRKRDIEELSIEDLRWVADNIKAKKVIFMGGEPFLYKHISEAFDLFSDSLITISTNGSITDKFIPLIKKYNVEGVQISVEGGKKETDYLRGEGTWDKCISLAKLLKKKKINAYLRASFWEGNLSTIHEVVKVGEELDVPIALFPRVDKPPLSPSLTRDLFDYALRHKNCVIALPNFFQYIGKRGRCSAGEERIAITFDRRITPCNMDLEYTIARVGDDVSAIKENMKIYVDNFKTIPVECAGCKNASVCKGSCYVAKAWLGCPLRYNVTVENYIANYKLDREKVYEKAEMLTDFMRKVLVC